MLAAFLQPLVAMKISKSVLVSSFLLISGLALASGGAAAPPQTAGGPPFDVLWVETNGSLTGYTSTANYANIVNLLIANPKANLTVISSGLLTEGFLSGYDAVIVPSLSNYDFAWTVGEYNAFDAFVQGGGCLYVWTDAPLTSHVAVDPLLARFGISRTGTETSASLEDWDSIIPGHTSKTIMSINGGHLTGGTPWLLDNLRGGLPIGVAKASGSGKVFVLGDGNVYAQFWNYGTNLAMLKVVLRECLL